MSNQPSTCSFSLKVAWSGISLISGSSGLLIGDPHMAYTYTRGTTCPPLFTRPYQLVHNTCITGVYPLVAPPPLLMRRREEGPKSRSPWTGGGIHSSLLPPQEVLKYLPTQLIFIIRLGLKIKHVCMSFKTSDPHAPCLWILNTPSRNIHP